MILGNPKPWPTVGHNIVELTPDNWEEIVFSPKHDVVVEFYSPYCGYCIEFAPTWNEIGDSFAAEDSVVIGKINVAVEANINHPLIQPYGIRGVPTLIVFPAKDKKAYKTYGNGQRTVALVTAWILANVDFPVEVNIVYKSQERPTEPVTPGKTTTVVGSTWKEIVLDTSKTVFVNFFAPWCPYSQRLAPIWDDFAKAMEDFPTVVIAKMDGTANEVPGLQLYAYPTLTIYKAGSNEAVQYRGNVRSVEAFRAFLMETDGPLKTKKEIEEQGLPAPQVVPSKKKNIDEKSDAQLAHDADELQTFAVREIDDSNIREEIIDQPKNVVVLFYADWMDDKQEVLAKWKEIALEFRFVTAINILQTDGAKNKNWGITLFPTIKLFKAHASGVTPYEVTFKGQDLKISNIATWIRENAVRTKDDDAARKGNKGGAFEGFKETHSETEAYQSLVYHDDL